MYISLEVALFFLLVLILLRPNVDKLITNSVIDLVKLAAILIVVGIPIVIVVWIVMISFAAAPVISSLVAFAMLIAACYYFDDETDEERTRNIMDQIDKLEDEIHTIEKSGKKLKSRFGWLIGKGETCRINKGKINKLKAQLKNINL